MKAVIIFAIMALAAQAAFDPVAFYKGLTGNGYKQSNETYHSIECVKSLVVAQSQIRNFIQTVDLRNLSATVASAVTFLHQFEECHVTVAEIKQYINLRLRNASNVERHFAAHYPEILQLVGLSIDKAHFDNDYYLAGRFIQDAVTALFEGTNKTSFEISPRSFVPFDSDRFNHEFIAGAISALVFNNATLTLGITECFEEATQTVVRDLHLTPAHHMPLEQKVEALYEFVELVGKCVEIHHLDLHVFSYLYQPALDHITETAFKVVYRALVNAPYLDKVIKTGTSSLIEGQYVETGRAAGKIIRYLLGGM